MKKYNLLKKVTAVATTATMLLSTAPLTVFAEEDTTYRYHLNENTMTDTMTGITVKGRLPYDCDMHVYVNFLQSTTFTDLSDSDSGISTLEDTETGFPKRGGKPVTTMSKPLNWEESTKEILNETLIPQIHIAFSYESEILDFDSNLLVTVPYDFYKYYGATSENNQVAVFTNGYTEDDTKGLTVVDQERVGKNAFTFKADAPGSFYIGNPNSLKEFATSLAVNTEDIAIPENNGETKVIEAEGFIKQGVTIETSNPKHQKAYVESPEQFAPFAHDINNGTFSKLKEDYMKEMFSISIEEEDLKDSDAKYFSTTVLDRNVKISIPSDNKDLYVINVNNTFSPYQLDAEYIDGKYVFETDTLGYFVLSSQPLPEYKEPELTQQTITDEKTGITVSGLLPTDATVDFNVLTYSNLLYTDFMDADNTAYSFNHSRYSLPQADKLYTIVSSSEYSEKMDWTALDEEHSVNVQILFRDGFRLLDFSSDLTVTLPHGFKYYLRDLVQAYKIDYNANALNPVEILPSEENKDFTFKANATGSYIIGVESNIEYILGDAFAKTEETTTTPSDTSNTEATTETTTETTQVSASANIPFSTNTIIIIIAGGVLLIAVVAVVIVLVKKKR